MDDIEAAAREAAERLAASARAGGHIALSGGSTPRRAYELAAELEPDWGAVELWWADERCVPPDSPDSNFALVRESLLDRLAQPPRSVHRIRGEDDPAAAAAAYDRELAGVTLDFVLLGIGPDGHTASLFPDAPTLAERERRAVAASPGLEPFVDRVTVTLPVLETAKEVVFLATGEQKAEAVAAVLGGEDPRFPASLVASRRPYTVAVVDAAASREVRGRGDGNT